MGLNLVEGVQIIKLTVSDQCVKTRGMKEVKHILSEGIIEEFEKLYKEWGGKGAKFHFVFSFTRPTREAK